MNSCHRPRDHHCKDHEGSQIQSVDAKSTPTSTTKQRKRSAKQRERDAKRLKKFRDSKSVSTCFPFSSLSDDDFIQEIKINTSNCAEVNNLKYENYQLQMKLKEQAKTFDEKLCEMNDSNKDKEKESRDLKQQIKSQALKLDEYKANLNEWSWKYLEQHDKELSLKNEIGTLNKKIQNYEDQVKELKDQVMKHLDKERCLQDEAVGLQQTIWAYEHEIEELEDQVHRLSSSHHHKSRPNPSVNSHRQGGRSYSGHTRQQNRSTHSNWRN